MVFIPRRYRTHKTVLYLFAVEFPFILVILILTGIASHNTYATKLWQDGANNGFNSAPNQIVYDLTNGRPYSVPIVWSSLYDTCSVDWRKGHRSLTFLFQSAELQPCYRRPGYILFLDQDANACLEGLPPTSVCLCAWQLDHSFYRVGSISGRPRHERS
jgi:hypothetical protein